VSSQCQTQRGTSGPESAIHADRQSALVDRCSLGRNGGSV